MPMMQPRRKSRMAALAAAGLLATLGAFAEPASAQGDRERLPPQVRQVDNPPTIWMYFVLFVLAFGAIGVNLLPSKRGHQD